VSCHVGLQNFLAKEEARSPSPENEDLVMLSKKEDYGPTADEDAEFAKELAKMLSDTSDARKVDKRNAQSILDSGVVHTARKKRGEGDSEYDGAESTNEAPGFMKFTLMSRKGNKQQVCG
jgi:regulator of nonsense transcripts 2